MSNFRKASRFHFLGPKIEKFVSHKVAAHKSSKIQRCRFVSPNFCVFFVYFCKIFGLAGKIADIRNVNERIKMKIIFFK